MSIVPSIADSNTNQVNSFFKMTMAKKSTESASDGKTGTAADISPLSIPISGGLAKQADANPESKYTNLLTTSENGGMSNLFVHANPMESKYLTAKMDSFGVASGLKNSFNSDMFTMLDATSGMTKWQIEQYIQNKENKEIVDSSEDDLTSTIEDIEKAAEEASGTSSENDNSISDAENSVSAATDNSPPVSKIAGETVSIAAAPSVSTEEQVVGSLLHTTGFSTSQFKGTSVDILV